VARNWQEVEGDRGMNKNDFMLLSFITIWIALTAGDPDLLDAIINLVMGV